MSLKIIKNKLEKLPKPAEDYFFIQHDSFFWGFDSKKNLAFATFSNSDDPAKIRNFNALKAEYNTLHRIQIEHHNIVTKKMNIITLKKEHLNFSESFEDTFMNLTYLFTLNDNLDFNTFFDNLSELFSVNEKPSTASLQGLYSELLTIYFFKEKFDFNLVDFYEGPLRKIFDFSIDDLKKIEVKSTIGKERIHKFKLDQLNSNSFNILIVSILLEKDAEGLSLKYLIDYFNNLSTFYKASYCVKKITWKCSDEDLNNLKYNKNLALKSLKIFKANDIPKIYNDNEHVTNIEFSSHLKNSRKLSDEEIINWLKNT